MKRGRPPKQKPTAHTAVEAGPDGRLRFVTRPGPKPPRRRGRPSGKPVSIHTMRDDVLASLSAERAHLLREVRLTMQELARIERDELLCVQVAEQMLIEMQRRRPWESAASIIGGGKCVTHAARAVARARRISYQLARDAFYAYRDRLEVTED